MLKLNQQDIQVLNETSIQEDCHFEITAEMLV